MAKPEKVRSSGAALLAEGIQLKRVQSLSTDIDITRDQVLELANSGIVQYVEQSPAISVTVDANEYGSVDNLSLLIGKLVPKTAASNAFADTGREGYLSERIYDKNNLTITEQDIVDGYCTLAVPILEESTSVARTMIIPRAAVTGYTLNFDVGGVATESFTLEAAEKLWYLNGWKDVRVMRLTNHNIGSTAGATYTMGQFSAAPPAFLAYSATAQCFFNMGTPLGTGAYPGSNPLDFDITPVAMIINDKVYMSTAGSGNGPYYFSTGEATCATSAAYTITMGVEGLPGGVSTPFAVEGDDVWLIYVPQTSQTWEGNYPTSSANPGYALTSTAGSYGGASKGYVDIYLFNTAGPNGPEVTATAAGKALRLQTVNFDVSITSEALDELGNDKSYAIIRNTPIPVNVTVTANDSDLEMWANAMALDYESATVTELYTGLFGSKNYVRVNVFRDKTKTTLLKTIACDSMNVIGDSHSVTVGGVASQELSFTCDNITVVGNNIEP